MNSVVAQWYMMHIEQHEQLLNQLSTALKHHAEFERAFSDFEAQKVCYLPIGAFLLKPVQRLLHYGGLLERECSDICELTLTNSYFPG